jgi:hypothetical protein
MENIISKAWPHGTKATWKLLVASAFTLATLVLVSYTAFSYSDDVKSMLQFGAQATVNQYASPRQSGVERPDFCNAFNLSSIALSIKTGATEPRNKIPTQLMTFLRCVPDVMLFSDLEQTLGSHELDNVLSHVTKPEVHSNPEFNLYWTQQEYAEDGREVELKVLHNMSMPYEVRINQYEDPTLTETFANPSTVRFDRTGGPRGSQPPGVWTNISSST